MWLLGGCAGLGPPEASPGDSSPAAATANAQTPPDAPSTAAATSSAPGDGASSAATSQSRTTDGALPPAVEAELLDDGMPSLDAMLYPLSAAVDIDAYDDGDRRVRYGFVDAAAKLVFDLDYLAYSYCFADGIPTRLVAALPDRVDIIALDGKIVRSIPAKARQYVWCHNNSQVVYYDSNEGVWVGRDTYDLATGRLLKSEGAAAEGDEDPGPWPAYPDDEPLPEPPPGFSYDSDGWANFAIDSTGRRAWLPATAATIDLPTGYTPTQAIGGFLQLDSESNLPSIILNSRGQLTEFSSLQQPDITNWDAGKTFAVPYWQAESADYIGFVDADGQWRYRQAKHFELED
jgi:hypothetical protein